MKRGPWHQCGDRSQKLVCEQLEKGAGVGVIISPRDLSFTSAVNYSRIYQDLEAEVLIDPQFYVPSFSNNNLDSYPFNNFRAKVSSMQPLINEDFQGIANTLRIVNHDMKTDGIICPAIIYEAGRQDIIQINSQLFKISKRVGTDLNIPTYATVVLGRSVTSSDTTLKNILNAVTSLDADGWYFAFEFEPERIPSSRDSIYRCCKAGLILACTGKPVLHAYAGPMALLSFCFGAIATAVGHSQNLWKFCMSRWQPPGSQGGGGDAPARFFSRSLWGTIVYPDEVGMLSTDLQKKILIHTPFTEQVTPGQPYLPLSRWEANKHLIFSICSSVEEIASSGSPREIVDKVILLLRKALKLHTKIIESGITLRDNTNVYQGNWRKALINLKANRSSDYDYLNLLL